jgi:hypothetical protein
VPNFFFINLKRRRVLIQGIGITFKRVEADHSPCRVGIEDLDQPGPVQQAGPLEDARFDHIARERGHTPVQFVAG